MFLFIEKIVLPLYLYIFLEKLFMFSREETLVILSKINVTTQVDAFEMKKVFFSIKMILPE